ncbi:DNA (cytosine-5-)-methyltransferase [Peptoanaerobacter stomatis]|uniref:Cytosine-specific methyltransferase n=1 Tax=Peptoanaerobacter stomatis TaxID=796937 RepID=J4W8B4_9FIRM|nr:DNA (cytosine-5-)-methyltransferase [Peptoanaerobacter stomatis]EJU22036.1 DNA (cytosine-5-)-methyltransferase [Peptoanaerobacter stomatis]
MIFINIVELFGGIGAFTKALKNMNIDHKIIDYVDIDKNCTKSYNALNNTNFSPKSVINYNLPIKKVDILMHGSPCQDFSNIGLKKGGKKGSGTRSSLLFETIRIIKESSIKPEYVIWENVKAVLNKNNKPVFMEYLNEMKGLGYVSSYSILNAMDFGIPQTRIRVFVISTLKKKSIDFNNLKQLEMPDIKNFLEKNVDEKYIVKQKSILAKINGTSSSNFKGRAKIITNHCYTITTNQVTIPNAGFIDLKSGNYRYLTEKECFRLMGFSDEDFKTLYKVFAPKHNQKSGILYKQAGNSIVVNVLQEIIREIIKKL